MAADGAVNTRGEDAGRPWDIPRRGWKDVLLRVKDEIDRDNLSIVAAGVAFYALFAVFPGITALVTLYAWSTIRATWSSSWRQCATSCRRRRSAFSSSRCRR